MFFAVVLSLYYVLNHRWQNVLLVVSSYFFYGWFDWRFCGLLALSTVIDWYCGLRIPGPNGRRWLYVSVISQLGLLGFFKYCNFFRDNFQALFEYIGWNADWWTLDVVLPLGISFYTFQTLSYTIDVGRGQLKPIRSLMDFAVFVSFWPHLVMGPILRASYMLPQVVAKRKVDTRNWAEGTYFILVGLVKKVAVADVLANMIYDPVQNPSHYSSWTLLLVCYMFAIRIYCDFSGYTDIARGVSLFMGFRLQENFRWPYFSVGITDFWRRWHMSLAGWLRDYLYIPLGGSRKGTLKTYRNIILTFTLCGLWHGPVWNFVFWGLMNGIYLSIGKMISGPYDRFMSWTKTVGLYPLTAAVLGLLTFQMMALTNILATIPGLRPTLELYQTLVQFTYTPEPDRIRLLVYAMSVILLIDVPEAVTGRHTWLIDKPFLVRAVIYTIFITLLILTWAKDYEPFFYFQF